MRTKFFYLIACVLLFLPLFVHADTNHLLISQVQITGGSGHTTNDFVEIYNPTLSDIDLKGYRLVKRTKTGTSDTSLKSWTASTIIKAHGFYLWANSAFTDIAATPDVTTTGSLADDNGVAIRNGPNDTGTIIDSLAWGMAANVFVEGSAFATNPTTNEALERLPGGDGGNGMDTGNNAADFVVVVAHPRNSQSAIIPVIVAPPSEPPPSVEPPPEPAPDSAPPSAEEVPAGPAYSRDILISEFLPNPDGADSGNEWVELSNASDQEVDLSGWILDDQGHDGPPSSNAYTLPDGMSIAAHGFLAVDLPDGSFVLNNSGGDAVRLFWPDETLLTSVSYAENAKVDASFALKPNGLYAWTELVTKGAANQFPEAAAGVTSAAQTKIKFNELLPNPTGSDSGKEWIEVINTGAEPIYLNNWFLDDGELTAPIGSSAYKISSVTLNPGNLAVITIPAGKFAMNNTGSETVRIFNENKILIDSVSFEGATEGSSYSFVADKWIWTDPTPNAVNAEPPPKSDDVAPAAVAISELYPEPSSGSEEFIELFNFGTQSVDLQGWQVADLATKYTFHSPTIEPGGYYVLTKSESQIALNNAGKEAVTLTDPNGIVVASVEYEDAPKNQSYNLLPDGTFAWSSVSTPGAANQIKVAVAPVLKGKVKGATLPRTGNDLPVSMADAFALWPIIWYIYIKMQFE